MTESGSSFEDSFDEESGIGSDYGYNSEDSDYPDSEDSDYPDSEDSDYPDSGDDYDYDSSDYSYDDGDCDSMEYCTDVRVAVPYPGILD